MDIFIDERAARPRIFIDGMYVLSCEKGNIAAKIKRLHELEKEFNQIPRLQFVVVKIGSGVAYNHDAKTIRNSDKVFEFDYVPNGYNGVWDGERYFFSQKPFVVRRTGWYSNQDGTDTDIDVKVESVDFSFANYARLIFSEDVRKFIKQIAFDLGPER